MLKAYVGIASKDGLSGFYPEREETLSLVRRSVFRGIRRIAFWAVIGESEARSIHALFLDGHRREAMMLLDCCSRDIGRILPSDVKHSRHR